MNVYHTYPIFISPVPVPPEIGTFKMFQGINDLEVDDVNEIREQPIPSDNCDSTKALM